MSNARGLEARRHAIIAILFTALLATAIGTSGCGKQMAQMENNQVKLQALIMANARQLAAISSQVHAGQNETNRALAQIDRNTQDIGAEILTVQNKQGQLHEAILSGNEQIHTRMAKLERNQASLNDGVARLADVAGETNATVNAVARDQATLHQMVQANRRELEASITAVAKSQETTHTGIEQLRQASHGQANALTALANGQEALAKLAQANSKQLVNQITTVSSEQQQLRNDLGNLHELTQTMAADVTTLGNEQKDLHGTLRSTATTLAEKIAILEQHQLDFQTVVDRVANTADTTAGDLTAVAATQAVMQEVQGTRYETLNGQLATVTQNQQGLQTSLNELDARAAGATAQLETLTTGQNAIQETMQANSTSVASELDNLSQNQKALHDDVTNLTQDAETLAADISTVIGSQAALQDAWDQSNEAVTAFAENQTALQHDLNSLRNQTDTMASDVSAVAQELSVVNANVTSGNEALVARTTTLTEGQQELRGSLETVAATASQMSLDVIAVTDAQGRLQKTVETGVAQLSENTSQLTADFGTVREGQNALNEKLAAHDQTVSNQMTDLNEVQGQIRGGLDTLTATTTQVALDVITLNDNQARQGEAAQANREQLNATLDTIANEQRHIRTGLDSLTATTTQVALDVIALDDKQTKQGEAAQTHQEQLAVQLDGIAGDQQQVQSGLDSLTATTTQVALDVITLNGKQTEQLQATQSSQQQLAGKLDSIAEGQQQIETSLDTVAATASQVALDVITLDSGQAELGKAVQLNRQELATKLAAVAQGQQEWLARFDAAQAQTETMTAGITALEQRVSKLQGTLQESLQDLNTLLDAESQQRVQFQEAVRQDMQSVVDSISQLREIQAGLAEHVQRVQDSTQSQTGDILSVLEQLQQRNAAEASDLGAELKSSKAAPPEIILP